MRPFEASNPHFNMRIALPLIMQAPANQARVYTQQSWLKAFRGELVPQDLNDEPASVLLTRVGSERQAAGVGRILGRASRHAEMASET